LKPINSTDMKHIPILFSTAMVQAIQAGRKTQTRRVVKPRSYICDVEDGIPYEMTEDDSQPIKCPYGQPGDVLWVRETWATCQPYGPDESLHWMYKTGQKGDAIPDHLDWYRFDDGKWRPSIHMPREAARLFLRIKSIRVERLQEISNDDIRAEGAAEFGCTTHRLNWQTLWQSINGPESWDANPWVWIVEFERISREEAGL